MSHQELIGVLKFTAIAVAATCIPLLVMSLIVLFSRKLANRKSREEKGGKESPAKPPYQSYQDFLDATFDSDVPVDEILRRCQAGLPAKPVLPPPQESRMGMHIPPSSIVPATGIRFFCCTAYMLHGICIHMGGAEGAGGIRMVGGSAGGNMFGNAGITSYGTADGDSVRNHARRICLRCRGTKREKFHAGSSDEATIVCTACGGTGEVRYI